MIISCPAVWIREIGFNTLASSSCVTKVERHHHHRFHGTTMGQKREKGIDGNALKRPTLKTDSKY